MSDLLPEGFVLDDAPAAPTGSALPDGFVLDDPAPATGTSELATDPGHIRANQVAAERAAKEPNLRNVPGPNGYSADNPPYKDGAYENRKQPPRPAQPEATWLTDLQSGWNNLMSGFAGTSLESGAKNEADTDRAIDAMKRAGTATPEQIAYLELRKKQIQQDQADAAQTLAIGAAKQAQLPPTPESVQRFNNATGWMDALSAFAADPYTISRSTILQSAPASIPSALGGIMGSILGPMGSSMGAGGGSYITELGGAVQEGLQRFGADMNDPASIMQVWSQHKAEISKYAQTRATVVGGADALTAGISSKFAGVNPVDQIIKGNIKRELLGIGIEAPGGMVGEAGAQLATEGRINQPGQVLAEGLGEVVPGAVQVAGSTVVQRALKGDRETAPQQPPPQPQQPAPGKGDRIEPQMFPEAQKAPVRPMQSNGYDVSPQTGDPSDDEVLHGAGYTPQQIAEMHPAEKAQEAADARAQGVQPKPLPPAPGTAPLAPGFRPTAPVSPESNPAGQIDAEPQVSTGNNSSPEKINSSPQLPAGFVVDQAKSPSQNSQNSALSPGPSESAGNYMPARGEVRAPFTPAPMAPRVQTAIYPPSQADKAFSTFFASKAPITPEALAKASGMPQKDAVKAIQRAALRGSIIQTRQGRWMRAPTRVKPISAMQFIASIGGISDPTGELAGMDLPKMGPYGPVVRKTGLHPDKVREALVEAGYMRDPGAEAGGQATTTVNDVYALLDNEMRGQKAYQPQDQATADALDTQAKNDALPPDYAPVHHIAQRFGVETWNKVKTALDTHGLDEGNWSTQELSDAARMVNEGQDPEDAIVAAAIRFEDDANDPESQFPEVQEWMRKRDPRATLLFDPPPFPDVEPANAGQENADAESPGGAQPLAGSEGPRVEEAPRSPREEAPVPRQDGGEGEGQQPAPAVEQGADNKPQTVLPGAEQLTPEQAKAAAAKDRARKELEIRQRQSKLRKGGQQSVEDQEGGMFAGEGPKQTSMLDQSAEQSSERETYPDGRWKPRLGDKVYQRVPGMFGTPASIVGYVRQNKDGNLVVKMEAGSSLLSGKQSMANKRPVPLSPAWTVMDDPQPARREAEAKAKQDAETQKWKDEMRAEDEAARKAAQDAIAAGADALTPENAKVGLEVFNHRQNQRQIIGEIGDFKEGRVVFTRPVGEEDEAPRSNGPMSYYSIPKKETAPQPDAEEKPAGRINILTNKFKAWFDGSKVVNADGNPLVVYHGTPAGDFTSFDTYASNYGLMGQGGYFTEDPSVASEYTSKGAAKMERRGETPAHTVYPVYLSIKNPIDMNAAPNVEAWVKAYGDYVTTDDFAEVKTNEDAYRVVEDALQGEYLPMHEGAEIMQDGLRAMGHDGITHIGGQYVRKDGKEHRVWIAFDPEQIKSIHNNGEFDRNNPAILSSRNTSDDGSSFAATVMRELAKVDDLFQNPRSDAKTLDGVIGDIVFGFEKIPNVPISEAERALGAVTKSGWRNEDGFDFFVLEDGDGQVWMDISNFAPGLRGSAPYAAVANYAHNVGKVFIGDPSGLSNDALRRRTEAMLSSAIKFGTTRHLEPHKRQLEGDPDLGIPPMEWTYGDDAANVASLINASIANTTNLTPEIANARFDFDTGTFRDAQGQRLSDEILDGWRRSDRRIREARASYSTIRRGVFLKSLAQAERGERPRLLEQALRELRQLVESGDLKATLYNRPGQSRVPPNRYRYNISPQQEAEITADIQATAKRILGRHLVGVEVRRDLSKEFSAEEDAVYDPNTGLIWVALQGLQDPKTSIRHEAIHALRNAGVFTAQEWAALSRMAQTRWIEQFNIRRRYEQLYRERFALNDAQIEELLAEEAIAEAFAEHLVESPQDESLPGRIFTRLRRFLEALRSALRGQGFTSVDKVLEDIDTGKVAAREAGQGQKRDFLLYGRQEPLSLRGRLPPPPNPSPGSFEAPHDERVLKALMDSTDTLLNRIRRAGKAAGVEFVRKLQDREIDLLRTQKAIERANGPIIEPQDAYLASSLYPGRVAQRDRTIVEEVVKPLIEDIASRGLTVEQVDEFARAQHAFERNAYIATIHKPGTQFNMAATNPALVGGSGLSNDQANAIIQRYRNGGKYADVKAMADRVVKMGRDRLDALLAEGLIEQETHDTLTRRYKHYVPLRGEDDATSEAHPDAPRSGRRYDVRGREIRQALGRSTLSDSPLAYSILQAREANIRIEKNRVGKRLLKLAQANPNEAFWEVQRKDMKRVLDKNLGYVRNVYDVGSTEAENVFAVKIGGKTWHVTLHHEGLLKAMKGIGAENMHGAFVMLHKINRLLAALNTSYDPEFIFRNFVRDLQHAGIVLQEEKKRGLTRAVVADVRAAAAGMNRMLRGDFSTVWARYAREYADAGGKMGFMDRNDIAAEKKALEKLMKQATATGARQFAQFAWEATAGRLERWNDSIENTLRLSTYVNLRRLGVSQDKAAMAARDLTVNFNRKGEWSAGANSLYLFFNASMQGAANMTVRLLRSKRMRQVAAGIVVMGFMQDMLNRMVAGDDDDDKNRYDKIPDDIKAKNAIIMLPKWAEEEYGIPYLKWPMPLGYNIFHFIGTEVGHTVAGVEGHGPLQAASNVIGVIGDNFNPLGQGGTPLNFFAPTLLDPVADIYTNKDVFGEDIVPKTFDEQQPWAERYRPNITPWMRWFTDSLSSLTGGSPERPGGIDISPEWIEHVWNFAWGGVGRLVTRASSTANTLVSDQPMDLNKVPFARVFTGQSSQFTDRDEYFRIRDAVEITDKELSARETEGNKDAAQRVKEKYSREVQMIPDIKWAEKRMAKLRKELKATKNREGMADAERKRILDEISKDMDAVQLRIRKRWNLLGKTEAAVPAN